jgi:hypothetical protein
MEMSTYPTFMQGYENIKNQTGTTYIFKVKNKYIFTNNAGALDFLFNKIFIAIVKDGVITNA